MLLCPLLPWAGWRLCLGQVIPGFYTVTWGITTLAPGMGSAPPRSLVLQHFFYFTARGNWGTE